MITANDILIEQVPSYLISARKALSEVEQVFNDPMLSVDLKKQKIAHIISNG